MSFYLPCTYDCRLEVQQRLFNQQMNEAMDQQIVRLLAKLNLATLDENGTVKTVVDDNGYTQIPELQASNTMVVVVGDNGSFFEVTKLPFDPTRSKGTVCGSIAHAVNRREPTPS